MAGKLNDVMILNLLASDKNYQIDMQGIGIASPGKLNIF